MLLWVSRLEATDRFANRDVLYAAMTRFNVAMPATPGAAAIRERDEIESWTRRRITVFQDLCLRSMLHLRLKPHAWVILFDREINPPVAELIAALGQHDWIVPLYCGDDWVDQVADETRAVLRERFGRRFSHVACTRLDSDDSLHTDFYAAVDLALTKLRQRQTLAGPLCIDFPFGVMPAGDRLMIQLKEKHVFVLVEPFDQLRTPYFCEHTRIDDHVPLRSVLTDRPMFVYQRHDANISGPLTRAAWDAFADRERVLGYFGLAPERRDDSTD
jgi:hypothetical protein